MSGYVQTCGACGQTGPLRYDNRGNRRCDSCWERVETPAELAKIDPAASKEESATTPVFIGEAEQAPVKATTKKGK